MKAQRALVLALASVWVLVGVLQFQHVFFTKAFSVNFIAAAASGNPSAIARPITFSANTIGHIPVLANTVFAVTQVLLGLGIAWRRTRRVALAGSVLWALGVWWIGEGLGGTLHGAANPFNGAPGAAFIYAVLAVLLWPSDREGPFVAGRAIGAPLARAIWVAFWGSMAYLSVTGLGRSPQGLRTIVTQISTGEPAWLGSINRHAASLVAGRGLTVSIVLAALFVVVGLSVFLPVPVQRATVVLAIVLALLVWVVGEDFGGILAGGATDPNSGPLLVLLALAYWPSRHATQPAFAGARTKLLAVQGG